MTVDSQSAGGVPISGAASTVVTSLGRVVRVGEPGVGLDRNVSVASGPALCLAGFPAVLRSWVQAKETADS